MASLQRHPSLLCGVLILTLAWFTSSHPELSASPLRAAGSGAGAGPDAGSAADAGAGADAARATALLERTAKALGGRTPVQTLRAVGVTRHVVGDYIAVLDFDLEIALPYRYVRSERLAAGPDESARFGFERGRLIAQPGARFADDWHGSLERRAPPRENTETRTLNMEGRLVLSDRSSLGAARLEFAALALGFFGRSFEPCPLTFSYAGRARAGAVTADVVFARTEAGRTMGLFLDVRTSLPVRVSDADVHFYFADYADTGGRRLPHRIRRAIGPDTVEEITIRQFRTTPPHDATMP